MNNENHTLVILAYNNHSITKQNIKYLKQKYPKCPILLFDNGSNPSFEHFSQKMNINYYLMN